MSPPPIRCPAETDVAGFSAFSALRTVCLSDSSVNNDSDISDIEYTQVESIYGAFVSRNQNKPTHPLMLVFLNLHRYVKGLPIILLDYGYGGNQTHHPNYEPQKSIYSAFGIDVSEDTKLPFKILSQVYVKSHPIDITFCLKYNDGWYLGERKLCIEYTGINGFELHVPRNNEQHWRLFLLDLCEVPLPNTITLGFLKVTR